MGRNKEGLDHESGGGKEVDVRPCERIRGPSDQMKRERKKEEI